jgi:hypothetical protein
MNAIREAGGERMSRSDKCESAFYIDPASDIDLMETAGPEKLGINADQMVAGLRVNIDAGQFDAEALFDAGTVVAVGGDGAAGAGRQIIESLEGLRLAAGTLGGDAGSGADARDVSSSLLLRLLLLDNIRLFTLLTALIQPVPPITGGNRERSDSAETDGHAANLNDRRRITMAESIALAFLGSI